MIVLIATIATDNDHVGGDDGDHGSNHNYGDGDDNGGDNLDVN